MSNPSIKGYFPVGTLNPEKHICCGVSDPKVCRSLLQQVPEYYVIPVKGTQGIIPVSVDDAVLSLAEVQKQKLDAFAFSKWKDSIEYLVRMGRKPGTDLAAEFKKVSLCCEQAATYIDNLKGKSNG